MTFLLLLATALVGVLADRECDKYSNGGRAKWCSRCKDEDATVCTACETGAVLDSVNSVCVAQCTNSTSEYYIEHCTVCNEYVAWQCASCEADYHKDTFGYECIKNGECPSDADPLCTSCDNWGYCETCKTGYQVGRWKEYCEARCNNYNAAYTEGCQRCEPSDTGSTVCTTCYRQYAWVSDDGGTCVPQSCAPRANYTSQICSGHGTCSKDEYGTASCICRGAHRNARNACQCEDGYEDSDGDDCVPTPCGGYDSHCSVCHIVGSYLRCLACKPGFMDTSLMCKVPQCEGCDTMDTHNDRPATCKTGYVSASNGYICIPENTCNDNSMPHCAWCEGGKCKKCQLYYTNTENGCNTPCADKNCGICDPTDPTKCLSCPRGVVPDCLPIDIDNSCAYSGNTLTTDGNCTAYGCVANVYSYFRLGAYGTYAATLECANHGTCNKDAIGPDGWTTGVCICDEGYDPTTNCVGCDYEYVKDEHGVCTKTSESLYNCGVYIKNKCISCKAGFSNPEKNCDTPCSNPSCAVCSPSDPDLCITCKGAGQGQGNSPPCYPFCEADCSFMRDDYGKEMVCAYTRDAVETKLQTGCFSSTCTQGNQMECAGFGSCVNSRCECDTGYRGVDCHYCAKGYIQLNNPYGCYKEYTGCTETCLENERCINYNGVSTCMSIYCFSGDPAKPTVCGGYGKCSRSGYCECNDPNANPDSNLEYPCRECKTGYALDNASGKCIRDNCVSGPHRVPYCKRCVTPDSFYCAECSGGLAPDVGTNTCSAVGGGNSLSGGAIAGIVIAVILILALAGFLVYWFVFRKRGSRGGSKGRQYVPAMGL